MITFTSEQDDDVIMNICRPSKQFMMVMKVTRLMNNQEIDLIKYYAYYTY